MSEEPKLTAREVLEQAFQLLLKEYSVRTVKLEKPLSTREETDWDPCRGSDYDYWDYKSIAVLKLGESKWGLAFGEFGDKRSYPATADCNITAFRLTSDKIPDSFSELDPHKLAIATTIGELYFDSSFFMASKLAGFNREIVKLIQKLLAKETNIDPKFVMVTKLDIQIRRERSDQETQDGTELRYSRNIIRSVVNFIETVLKE